MNFFKKSFQSLFNRDITATLVPKVRIIGDLPYKIVYPYDLLSVLNNCLPSILYKKVEISGNQIKAYDMVEIPRDDNGDYKFLASCYAVLIDDTYYGTVIGDNKLWSCPYSLYHLKKTNYIDVILRISQKWIYTLQFGYNAADLSLNARFLQRTKLKSTKIPPERETLIAFSGGNYPAALACAKKNFNV